MRRRKFMSLLGGAAATWPLAARAQPSGKLRTIGFLGAGASSASAEGPRLTGFVQRLRELGWIDGRNLTIEFRWAEGHTARHVDIAGEFVRLKVDVIMTYSASAVLAAKQATSTIPIVFAGGYDPVGMGLVASLAHPGGNVTGISNQSADIAGKRLELLRETIPALSHVGLLANVKAPNALLEIAEVRSAAQALGIGLVELQIQRAEEITPAIKALDGRAQALYVVLDPVVNNHRVRIIILALGARLPTLVPFREYVEVGGLMCYAPNQSELFRRSAEIIDKVLRGTKPADIPVEQPTKFDLIINLTTAKAIGLSIPDSFLLRADEVIE
jgi:putative ABC transport system substrate-binding protein